MKKQVKKLQLHRETLTTLKAEEIKNVAGGDLSSVTSGKQTLCLCC